MITVVTSFSTKGYQAYAKRFIKTWGDFGPKTVNLLAYHEGEAPAGVKGVDLLKTEPCASFLERNEGNPYAEGRLQYKNLPYKPNPQHPRNFRYDAVKFARKVFAIAHAAATVRHGKLFWIDADMEFMAPVTEEFLHRMLPDDAGISHLARPGYHSECGFVGYNLDFDGVHAFIADFAHVYAADRFFDYTEWHDSFIFDRLLERTGVKTHRIPHTSKGTPVEYSPLGACMMHFKGERKISPERRKMHLEKHA